MRSGEVEKYTRVVFEIFTKKADSPAIKAQLRAILETFLEETCFRGIDADTASRKADQQNFVGIRVSCYHYASGECRFMGTRECPLFRGESSPAYAGVDKLETRIREALGGTRKVWIVGSDGRGTARI